MFFDSARRQETNAHAIAWTGGLTTLALIFLATHGHDDPVARLRRFRRFYWLSIALLVASCGAITAAAGTLWPELPPEHESSGD
jgi:hypothetical protein